MGSSHVSALVRCLMLRGGDNKEGGGLQNRELCGGVLGVLGVLGMGKMSSRERHRWNAIVTSAYL